MNNPLDRFIKLKYVACLNSFSSSKPHWNILNIAQIKRIAVGMEICPLESDEKEGVVYVSVVVDY